MSDKWRLNEALKPGELLVRVRTRADVEKPFVAGMIYDTATDRVVRAAPILRHLVGRSADDVRDLGARNGWRVTIVKVGE